LERLERILVAVNRVNLVFRAATPKKDDHNEDHDNEDDES